MARQVEIYCKFCSSPCVINKTERMHHDLSRFYCSCRNHECGHRFVLSVEYSHATRASSYVKNSLIHHLINQLSDKEKADIIKLISQPKIKESA
ncbi:transcriptional regulator [Pasteurellaceae bacterium HPA106]|uniref:ogr/Delta-like zinc finger family protein n=1 Tax=Spirabiliibacterium pneumoniae TaxID=221400 RepID=UPI001AADF6B7|nr:ogr/Delta-like zinc finger family protein [Spirabiliibacterium pneumoniae]MBE2895582.1 transcriptional regulator [Spirabiliibacterium pneumoniae]